MVDGTGALESGKKWRHKNDSSISCHFLGNTGVFIMPSKAQAGGMSTGALGSTSSSLTLCPETPGWTVC